MAVFKIIFGIVQIITDVEVMFDLFAIKKILQNKIISDLLIWKIVSLLLETCLFLFSLALLTSVQIFREVQSPFIFHYIYVKMCVYSI